MLWFQFRLPQNFFRERYSKRFANFLQELLENDHKTIIFFKFPMVHSYKEGLTQVRMIY